MQGIAISDPEREQMQGIAILNPEREQMRGSAISETKPGGVSGDGGGNAKPGDISGDVFAEEHPEKANPGRPNPVETNLGKADLGVYGNPFAATPDAPFLAGTPCLDMRRDVDAQVQAAFFCAETDAILLTANCFVRTIPELQVVPLAEDWHQEYGIIYRANPSRTVRKYIDLAVAQYAGCRR